MPIIKNKKKISIRDAARDLIGTISNIGGPSTQEKEQQRQEQVKSQAMSKPQTAQPKTTEQKPQQQDIAIRNQDTGRVTGVKKADGKVILMPDKKGTARDIQGLQAAQMKQQAEQVTPQGTLEAGSAAARSKAEQLFQQFQGQQLPNDILSTLTPSEIDTYQALSTGATSALPGIVGGAVTGAVAGSAGGPIGAVGGAIIGGLGTALGGIRGNIKEQIGEKISASGIELTRGTSNLKMIIRDINSGGDPSTDVELFYKSVEGIIRSHQLLKLETQRDLAKFTGNDGTPVLAKYEMFINYQLPLLERELQQAIQFPNPNKALMLDNSGEQNI